MPRTLPTNLVHEFEDEVFFSLRRQRNIFGWVALFSLLVAALSVTTLMLVFPLKEVRPYVVMVDRATGQSEHVVQVRPANLTEEEAVRQAELVRYVSDRETYDPTDNAQRIPLVLERSVDQAATSLRALWNASHEAYPPNTYGRDVRITVIITSISLLDNNTAQVRFARRREAPGTHPIVRDFVATVGFAFAPRVERRLEDVWRNPLGFRVTSYRVDAETLHSREVDQ